MKSSAAFYIELSIVTALRQEVYSREKLDVPMKLRMNCLRYNLSFPSFKRKSYHIHNRQNIKGRQDCECHFGEGAAVSQNKIDEEREKQTPSKVEQSDR